MLTTSMPASNVGKHPYLKLNSHTSRAIKTLKEPPDHTGNEPTPDIPIGGSGQDIIKRQIHAICEKHADHETCSSPMYRKGG